MFSRKYTINFLCEYDMAWYPFDLQRCELNFEPFGNSGDYVVFINKEINYYDKIDLSKYYIKQWQFVAVKKRHKGVVEGLSIKFNFFVHASLISSLNLSWETSA